MGWKRTCTEGLVWLAGQLRGGRPPARPLGKVFILRNNDIGDLLIITPLFEALKSLGPQVSITVGIGDWNRPLLENNPHVSEVLSVHAPWHNQAIHGQGATRSLRYILQSPEVKAVRARQFPVGIDIVGSQFGSFLMLQAGIPWRLGVKGFAGGHTAVHQWVPYNEREHVGRSALRFAELLGATRLPENRPQVFLTAPETEAAEKRWRQMGGHADKLVRVVCGPGGGFPAKCWPLEHYLELCRLMTVARGYHITVVGGTKDREAGAKLGAVVGAANDWTGKLALRETLATVARCDLVLCNSSMLMHAAAAFQKPALVLLGDFFPDEVQHMEQWGYPGLSLVFGKSQVHPQILTPAEAFTQMERLRQGVRG